MKKNNYFKSYVPNLFISLKSYNKKTFFKDLKAGCLVGIVTLPLAIALSIASGLGPVPGMITSIIGGFVAAVLGGSNYQVSGVTGAFTVVISSMLLEFNIATINIIGLLAGIVLVLMGLFKLGKFAKYIPFPVVTAFSVGIAFVISLSQVKDFFGLTLTSTEDGFKRVIAIINAFPTINWRSTLIGVISIASILIIEKINKKLPAMFLALIVATVLNLFINSTTLGDAFGMIKVNFTLDFGFVDFSDISQLIVPAIKIALISALSTLLTVVTADEMTGTVHNPHSELFAQGVATVAAVGFGGIASAGVIARTNENVKNGAKTPVSAIVHCFIMLGWALVFMPIAIYIPLSAFSAVLFIVCKNMVSVKKLKSIFKSSVFESCIFLLAFVLTSFVDLILAIFVSTAIAFIYELFIVRLFNDKSVVNICYQTEDNTTVAYISGRLNFFDIYKISKLKTDTVNVDGITFIDTTALKYLSGLAKRGIIKNIYCTNEKIHAILDGDKEISKHYVL